MLRDKVTITELELLCYLCKPHTIEELTRFLCVQREVMQIYTSRLNKKGLIEVENPRTRCPAYRISDKGAAILDKLDDLRFA